MNVRRLRPRLRRPWHWRKVEEASLARYVNAECVAEVVPPVDPEGEATVRDLLDDGRHELVAEHVYNLISDHGIDYDVEGYVPDTNAVQRIRTPVEMWNRQRGTCLDLALLYAGACLNEGLRPLVVVLDGHALAAVVTAQFPLPLPEPSSDADMLMGWIEAGSVAPVECTGMADGENYDFDFSTAKAKGRELIESTNLDFFFDPRQLQQDGRVEPEPCHRLSIPRVVASLVAAAVIVGGGLWFLTRPGPPVMATTGGSNLAVFPFGQVGDDGGDVGTTMASALALSLRDEFNSRDELQSANQPGWDVWGPTQLAADTGDAPALSDNLGDELAKRNIDVAVYGLVEEANDRTFTDVNIWFQPSQRGSLGGLSGPVEVRRDFDGSNGSVGQVADDVTDELDGWFTVLSGLGLVQDAESVDDLLAARARFDDAAQIGQRTPDGQQLRALAELLIGGTHLLIDSTIRADEDDARRLNLQLATNAYGTAIAIAVSNELTARAHLGLAEVSVLSSGCEPDEHDDSLLAAADDHVATAASSAPATGTDDPAELRYKSMLMEARVEWCRWAAGRAEDGPAVALLDQVIADFEGREQRAERQRTEHLAAQAYALRALIRGGGTAVADLETAVADAVRAQCLSPDLSTAFLRDRIRGQLEDRLADSYPELTKESCRG